MILVANELRICVILRLCVLWAELLFLLDLIVSLSIDLFYYKS